MKKILTVVTLFTYLLSSGGCFIFQKKEKFGCPGNGSIIGAERLAASNYKALEVNSKTSYKGRKSF